MLITIDTNMLIWGIRKDAIQTQKHMIDRAASLLEWIKSHGHTLALTAPCVAEYFVGASDDQIAREMKVLSSRFLILPYDANAAVIAAKLRSDKEFIKQIQAELQKTAVAIKADVTVVATAKAHGVERIYSHDTGVRTLANRCNMSAMDMPDPSSHANLPPRGTKSQREMVLFDEPPSSTQS